MYKTKHITLAAALLAAITLAAHAAETRDPLAEGFAKPPRQAKPDVFWYWVNGNVNAKGITLDLEQLARLDFDSISKYDISLFHDDFRPRPPALGSLDKRQVIFNSPKYWEMMRHTLKECERLGLGFYPHNCTGWTPSGGPWITKENGYRCVAFETVTVQGPKRFEAPLGQRYNLDPFDQIAVLAFPTPEGAAENLWSKSPKVSVTAIADFEPAVLHDGKSGWGEKAARLDKDHSLLIELDKPATFRSARMHARGPRKLVLESSEDGREFKPISVLMPEQFAGAGPDCVNTTMSYAPVTARFFRLRCASGATQVSEFDMSNAEVVHNLAGRALWDTQYELATETAGDWKRKGLDPATFIDLSDKIDGQRKLTWDVPAGSWTILSIGQGVKGGGGGPGSVEKAGQGWQCDILSADAVAVHFEGGMLPTIKLAEETGVKCLNGVQFDSWEVGQMNWTRGFEKEFQKRRGYDLKPFLPALAGHVVGDRDATERFLWDFRRTIGDLFIQNYAQHYREMSKKHGLKIQIQTYGGSGSPFDELRYCRYADIPQCEVWGGPNGYVYQYAQGIPGAAHVFGRNLISCESLTGAVVNWDLAPGDLKRTVDWILASGVNKMYINCANHQPWDDPVGGVFGFQLMPRGNPWSAHCGDWIKYISRSQFLLQQGRFAASMVYIYGEDNPMRLTVRKPDVPYGYQWDPCPADYAIEAMSVENGRIAFPSGMRYDVLLLPPDERLTPELLRKVKEVVLAGATVLGRKPTGSPTLSDYPACDEQVRKLASELWPESVEPGAVRQVGKGRMINAWNAESVRQNRESYGFRDQSLLDAYIPKIFAQLGLKPDFTFTTGSDGKGPVALASSNVYKYNVEFIHRLLDDGGELFFLANNSDNPLAIAADFRVSGLEPQLWYPDTGLRVAAPAYKEEGGRTKLPIAFDPAGSVFVVFRKPGQGAAPEPHRDYQAINTTAIAGPWEVTFQENRGAPPKATFDKLISWPEHSEFGIKYFAGTAIYRQTVTIAEADAKKAGARWRLDLGQVHSLAGIKVNGVGFGTLWKRPYVVDITRAIKAGENRIEIEVTNNLFNRLVGDAQLPDDEGEREPDGTRTLVLKEWPEWFLKGEPRPTKRVTLLDRWPQGVTKDTPLKPSGLIGPVTLVEVK